MQYVQLFGLHPKESSKQLAHMGFFWVGEGAKYKDIDQLLEEHKYLIDMDFYRDVRYLLPPEKDHSTGGK